MKRWFCAFLALLIIIGCTGCGDRTINTREDVEGKRIGVLAGTTSELYGKLHGEVRVCSDKKELINALKLGDVECIIADSRDAGYIKRFRFGLKTLSEPLAKSHFRFAAAKENPDLIEDINSAIADLSENGVINKIIKGYYDDTDYSYAPKETQEFEKTLTVAVAADFTPYQFVNTEGELRGIDIDLAKAVCAYLGYNAEFIMVDGSKLISAVQGGTAHFAAGGITANSENADRCIMSEPYAICTQVIIVD